MIMKVILRMMTVMIRWLTLIKKKALAARLSSEHLLTL